MEIAILQHDIHWASPAENYKQVESLLSQRPGADLYVLCEMWSTGFATKQEDFAEDNQESLNWMIRMANKHNAAFAGSIATKEDGHYYNRFYFVKPDGSYSYYDKRHLFTYGGEDKCLKQGGSRVVVEWRGARFLLEVCYDLRFPVWSRNHVDKDSGQAEYDAILYVANWPTSRIDVWNTLLRARAIENQCFVVGVNRIGKDPNCIYCGASAIIDPYGRTIAECERDKECIAEAELDMESLATFREKFPVLRDADCFSIQTNIPITPL